MKKFILMVHIFLALWAMDSWTTLAAAQTTTSACTSKYLIGYFNGVFNTPDQAAEIIFRLRDEFPATHKGKLLGITRFYNPTDPGIGDLAESFKQATQGDLRLKDKWELILLNSENKYLSLIDVSAGDLSAILPFLVDVWAKKVAQYIPGTAEQTLIKKMQGYMDNKVAIVAVAHSQGNFFADAVYKAIRTRLGTDGSTVKFVHVAPPVSILDIDSDDGDYILNKSDLIINAVRKFNPSVVEGFDHMDVNHIDTSVVNVIPQPSPESGPTYQFPVPPDFLGHFFLETYMNKGYTDGTRVRNAIQTALDKVQDYPCAVLSISPTSPNVSVGSTLQLTATAQDPTGKSLPIPTGLVWFSNNNAIATVDATGVVSGVAVGQANITVTNPASKNTASAIINVTAPTPNPLPVTLVVGGTKDCVSGTVTDKDGPLTRTSCNQIAVFEITCASGCAGYSADIIGFLDRNHAGTSNVASTAEVCAKLDAIVTDSNFNGVLDSVVYSGSYNASTGKILITSGLIQTYSWDRINGTCQFSSREITYKVRVTGPGGAKSLQDVTVFYSAP